ncbi:MAG: DUF3501 family protein [Gammaproteobacteria bacterium]|nr:DUF3501 family protein [Gammaproteobacteria bacterium]
MDKLSRADLFSLERYHEIRAEFRSRVLAHKRPRQVPIGPNATLYFEDRLTIQYQIQEMLRVERIFEAEAIEEELAAYNPLIPDGTNLKATFMLEYEDPDERRRMLGRLRGIEDLVWLEVGAQRIVAVADEDLDRATDDKTSAVHFLRFQLPSGVCDTLGAGASMRFGIEHDQYRHDCVLSEESRAALVADLD